MKCAFCSSGIMIRSKYYPTLQILLDQEDLNQNRVQLEVFWKQLQLLFTIRLNKILPLPGYCSLEALRPHKYSVLHTKYSRMILVWLQTGIALLDKKMHAGCKMTNVRGWRSKNDKSISSCWKKFLAWRNQKRNGETNFCVHITSQKVWKKISPKQVVHMPNAEANISTS